MPTQGAKTGAEGQDHTPGPEASQAPGDSGRAPSAPSGVLRTAWVETLDGEEAPRRGVYEAAGMNKQRAGPAAKLLPSVHGAAYQREQWARATPGRPSDRREPEQTGRAFAASVSARARGHPGDAILGPSPCGVTCHCGKCRVGSGERLGKGSSLSLGRGVAPPRPRLPAAASKQASQGPAGPPWTPKSPSHRSAVGGAGTGSAARPSPTAGW